MKFLEKNNIIIKNTKLLNTAFTHTSYANEHRCKSYERLEYLGDAVLELLTSEYLYNNTNLKEGEMSKFRSNFVCESALALYGRNIGLDKEIKVGNGLLNNINDTIIADVFEALLAVIYLDLGINECRNFFDIVILPHIKKDEKLFSDYKTVLQEMVQTDKKSLEYVLVDSYGEAHNMTFKVNVMVDGIVLGTGIGHSKKEAEQNAAKEAIKKSAR